MFSKVAHNVWKQSLFFMLVAGTPLLLNAPVYARGITVNQVHTEVLDDVLYLNAAVDIKPGKAMLGALQEGVPLTFAYHISILRRRDYWLDDTVARLEQRYRLEYHALTQQYFLVNLNSGSQFSFPSLEAAISVLGTIVRLPLLDVNLLRDREQYVGQIQVRIDDEALPVPLRLLSYFSSDWRLKSEWYTWPIHF